MTQHKRIAHHDHFSPSRVLFLSFPGVPWIWLQFFIYSSLIFFLTWGNDWQIMEQLKPDMRQWSVNNQRNLQPFQNQPSPHVCGHTAAHSWGQSKIYDWGDQITQGVNIVSVSSLWIWCLLVNVTMGVSTRDSSTICRWEKGHKVLSGEPMERCWDCWTTQEMPVHCVLKPQNWSPWVSLHSWW